LQAGNLEINHIGGMRTTQTMRVVLQDKPYISVYFPKHWTELQKDIWLAKWFKNRNQTH